MSYSEFTFQKLEDELQLSIEEEDLFSSVQPTKISEFLSELLKENVPLALSINTEKARSELIIAPVLVELRKILAHKISLFSGVELNIDHNKGLNGVCDFIISASNKQIMVTAPIITIVEAKNENIKSGIPQCIAEMYAAQLFNSRKDIALPVIYGAVTTGSSWKFMQLQKNIVIIDCMEYFIDNINKIMAILTYMINKGHNLTSR
ncbi:hypothetical protein TI05_00565 [Achromatium sp. WMS3]|nr:hypothetical protein TI05_00565 [Achromatium sp. WMS3]